ncbi:hypothetical protein Q7687_24045, partial [Escherichia coli]
LRMNMMISYQELVRTFPKALKVAPTAITGVVVPEKYKWWKVPGTPPSINKDAEAKLALVAIVRDTKPILWKIKAKDTVANTSKKPSTHK